MENSNQENDNIANSKPDDSIELLKAQLEGGANPEDALEAMFRAAQEADKVAAKEAREAAKKTKREPAPLPQDSFDVPQGGFLTVGDGAKSFSGESIKMDFGATEDDAPPSVQEDPIEPPQDDLAGPVLEVPIPPPAEEYSLEPPPEYMDEGLDMAAALENALKEAQESLERQGEWDDPFASENDENLPVKKYIVYIDREFVKTLDAIDPDSRNAYINESIKMKLAKERGKKRLNFTKKFFKHALVVFITVVIGTPIIFKLVNVSIDLTISNYSYVQKNFENLYRERAEKGRGGRIDMR